MKNKVIISLVGALLAFSTFLMGRLNQPIAPLGSVGVTSGYLVATSTNDNVIPRNSKVCVAGQTFGGVLVSLAGTAGGTFDLYDGTTTQSHPASATTTLAHFASNVAVGFYPYDVVLRYGLVVDPISNNLMGSTTIFCR